MASPAAGDPNREPLQASGREEAEGVGAAAAVRVWTRTGDSWQIWNVGAGPSSQAPASAKANAAKEGGKGPAGPQMEVQVLNIHDRSWLSVMVPRGANVGRLKGAIEAKTRISRTVQRLVSGGALLTDRTPLSSLASGKEGAAPPILLATMLVVHELQRHESSNSSWYFNQGPFSEETGSVDALEVEVSKAVQLVGLGVYGSGGKEYTTVVRCTQGSLEMDWRDREEHEMAKAVHTYTIDEDKTMEKLMFTEPCTLEPGTTYTISASVWGEPGVYGVGGQESVVHDDSGVEFTFRHSNGSNNGTEVASGNLPALYFHC